MAALQTRLEAIEARAGLQIDLRAEGENTLSIAIEEELYKIALEALNNVVKHAKAEHVTVHLRFTAQHCAMTILDDGVGFDLVTVQGEGGLGLRNIAERAQQIGGNLLVDHGRAAHDSGCVGGGDACPLTLAVPVAVTDLLNRAAQAGIIVKGGTAIEQIGHATAVVFDKEGGRRVGEKDAHDERARTQNGGVSRVGHALVAALTPNGDLVSKISIIPHSRGSLGYTMQLPIKDRYLLTMVELLDKIAVMLGGRAAEKVIFDMLSTGASDDIMRASELARRMVTEYGMSEKLGSVRYAGQQLQYLGGAVQDDSQISPDTRQLIDGEVQRIVTEQSARAYACLRCILTTCTAFS